MRWKKRQMLLDSFSLLLNTCDLQIYTSKILDRFPRVLKILLPGLGWQVPELTWC